MRCHNGIPPNRTGISWTQILAPWGRNIALVSCLLSLRGMVAYVHITAEVELIGELLWHYLRSALLRNHDLGSNSEQSHNIPVEHLPPETVQQGFKVLICCKNDPGFGFQLFCRRAPKNSDSGCFLGANIRAPVALSRIPA
jgi:hypothetical protein